MSIAAAVTFGMVAAATGALWKSRSMLRRRGLNHCLIPLLRDSLRRRHAKETHVLLCVADHFEPLWGDPTVSVARRRVENWITRYPQLFNRFRDSDGRPPRHSFFFPIDQYVPEHVDALARLCRDGFGEVEIHLHHDHDTADNLRSMLTRFGQLFSERHRLLGRRKNGSIAYGFIHGNWALDNSRPDGRWCGVNNELDILRQTGCYADFTLPSAPSPTQTRTINQIYYAVDDPCCAKSHDTGIRAGTQPPQPNALMMIQGPLMLDWKRRKLENGCLQKSQPPSLSRLDRWLDAQISVPQRPDWLFVKLHTHGAPESNQEVLLGEPMAAFHRGLAERAARDSRFHFHYVTAREMYNLARAAESGFTGMVRDALDFEIVSNLRNSLARRAA